MNLKERVLSMITKEFREYAKWTKETAIYPTKEIAITCSLLGLGGESIETYESKNEITIDDDLLKKEYGDILWYIGQLALVTGIVDDIDVREVHGGFSELFEYVGKIQENFKKVVRDFDFDLEKSGKRDMIISLVNDLIYQIYMDASDFDYDFFEILAMNKEKLTSRMQRGVISGSGDNR